MSRGDLTPSLRRRRTQRHAPRPEIAPVHLLEHAQPHPAVTYELEHEGRKAAVAWLDTLEVVLRGDEAWGHHVFFALYCTICGHPQNDFTSHDRLRGLAMGAALAHNLGRTAMSVYLQQQLLAEIAKMPAVATIRGKHQRGSANMQRYFARVKAAATYRELAERLQQGELIQDLVIPAHNNLQTSDRAALLAWARSGCSTGTGRTYIDYVLMRKLEALMTAEAVLNEPDANLFADAFQQINQLHTKRLPRDASRTTTEAILLQAGRFVAAEELLGIDLRRAANPSDPIPRNRLPYLSALELDRLSAHFTSSRATARTATRQLAALPEGERRRRARGSVQKAASLAQMEASVAHIARHPDRYLAQRQELAAGTAVRIHIPVTAAALDEIIRSQANRPGWCGIQTLERERSTNGSTRRGTKAWNGSHGSIHASCIMQRRVDGSPVEVVAFTPYVKWAFRERGHTVAQGGTFAFEGERDQWVKPLADIPAFAERAPELQDCIQAGVEDPNRASLGFGRRNNIPRRELERVNPPIVEPLPTAHYFAPADAPSIKVSDACAHPNATFKPNGAKGKRDALLMSCEECGERGLMMIELHRLPPSHRYAAEAATPEYLKRQQAHDLLAGLAMGYSSIEELIERDGQLTQLDEQSILAQERELDRRRAQMRRAVNKMRA